MLLVSDLPISCVSFGMTVQGSVDCTQIVILKLNRRANMH